MLPVEKEVRWIGWSLGDLRELPWGDCESALVESPPHQGGAMKKPEIPITRSSGNVFRDMGFPPRQAARLLIRADLMIEIREILRARRLTQARAAKLLRVTQPRVSDLMRGRIELFSIDTLIDMLARLGVSVTVRTRRPRRAA